MALDDKINGKTKFLYGELYERAIVSLSKLECPDFSDEDGQKTLLGFYEMFWNPEIYESFIEDIVSRSDGKVSFDHKSSQELNIPMIQCPHAKYFILSDGKQKKAVSFSPAARPFRFYNFTE